MNLKPFNNNPPDSTIIWKMDEDDGPYFKPNGYGIPDDYDMFRVNNDIYKPVKKDDNYSDYRSSIKPQLTPRYFLLTDKQYYTIDGLLLVSKDGKQPVSIGKKMNTSVQVFFDYEDFQSTSEYALSQSNKDNVFLAVSPGFITRKQEYGYTVMSIYDFVLLGEYPTYEALDAGLTLKDSLANAKIRNIIGHEKQVIKGNQEDVLDILRTAHKNGYQFKYEERIGEILENVVAGTKFDYEDEDESNPHYEEMNDDFY